MTNLLLPEKPHSMLAKVKEKDKTLEGKAKDEAVREVFESYRVNPLVEDAIRGRITFETQMVEAEIEAQKYFFTSNQMDTNYLKKYDTLGGVMGHLPSNLYHMGSVYGHSIVTLGGVGFIIAYEMIISKKPRTRRELFGEAATLIVPNTVNFMLARLFKGAETRGAIQAVNDARYLDGWKNRLYPQASK